MTTAPSHYDVLVGPVITEKATLGSDHDKTQVTFKVAIDATKPQIKAAVEAIYGTKVASVNTLVQKGKIKRFRGVKGRRPDVKKAIITLAAGQSIDVTGTGSEIK